MAKPTVADPMSRVTLVVLAILAFTALAGCSKAPPSGELASGASGVNVDSATSENVYVEASRPAGGVPMVGGSPMLCPPPTAPGPKCVPASSSYTLHFMALPQPDAQGYKAFLVGPVGQMELGAVEADAANMWKLNRTIDGDQSSNYTTLELRMGSFVVATASAADGSQTFALADGLSMVSAQGSYKGKVLNVTVSGLPANGTYTGYLYTLDAESGLLTRQDPFPIRNGANEYTAPLNVADYAEFHIHVGSSMVNLYKTTVA